MVYETIEEGKEWQFRSHSKPWVKYTVKLNSPNVKNYERAGFLTCNCPSWCFKATKKRTCKHCEEILQRELLVTEQIDYRKRRVAVYGSEA